MIVLSSMLIMVCCTVCLAINIDIGMNSILNNNSIISNPYMLKIISFSSSNLNSFAFFGSLVNKAYSLLYGNITYTLFDNEISNSGFEYDCEVKDRRWNKVCILQYLLYRDRETETHESGLYYMWMDIDMIILNYSTFQPTQLISRYPNAHMIISSEFHIQSGVANTGCFILKSSNFSRFLLHHWWNDYLHEIGHDQTHFSELILSLTEQCRKCRINHPSMNFTSTAMKDLKNYLNLNCWNPFVYNFIDYIAIIEGNRLNSYPLPVYKHQMPSDTVLHLMGERNEVRSEIFKYAVMQLNTTVQHFLDVFLHSKQQISVNDFLQLIPVQFGLTRSKMISIMIDTVSSMVQDNMKFLSSLNISDITRKAFGINTTSNSPNPKPNPNLEPNLIDIINMISDNRELIIQMQQYYDYSSTVAVDGKALYEYQSFVFSNRIALYESQILLEDWIVHLKENMWKEELYHLQLLCSVLHTYAVIGNDLRVHDILVYRICHSDVDSSINSVCFLIHPTNASSSIAPFHDQQLQYYLDIQSKLIDLWIYTQKQKNMISVSNIMDKTDIGQYHDSELYVVQQLQWKKKMLHIEEMISMHIYNEAMFKWQYLQSSLSWKKSFQLNSSMKENMFLTLLNIVDSLIDACNIKIMGFRIELSDHIGISKSDVSLAKVLFSKRLFDFIDSIIKPMLHPESTNSNTKIDMYGIENMLISIAEAVNELYQQDQHMYDRNSNRNPLSSSSSSSVCNGNTKITTEESILWFNKHVSVSTMIHLYIIEIVLYHHEMTFEGIIGGDEIDLKQNDLVYIHSLHTSCVLLINFIQTHMEKYHSIELEVVLVLYKNIVQYRHYVELLCVPSRITLLEQYISMYHYDNAKKMMVAVEGLISNAHTAIERYCIFFGTESCCSNLKWPVSMPIAKNKLGIDESASIAAESVANRKDITVYWMKELRDMNDTVINIESLCETISLLLRRRRDLYLTTNLDNELGLDNSGSGINSDCKELDTEMEILWNNLLSSVNILITKYPIYTHILSIMEKKSVSDVDLESKSQVLIDYISHVSMFIQEYIILNRVTDYINDVIDLYLSNNTILELRGVEFGTGMRLLEYRVLKLIDLLLQHQLVIHEQQQLVQSEFYTQRKKIVKLTKKVVLTTSNNSNSVKKLKLDMVREEYNNAIASLNTYILQYYMKTIYIMVKTRYKKATLYTHDIYQDMSLVLETDPSHTSCFSLLLIEMKQFHIYYNQLNNIYHQYYIKYKLNVKVFHMEKEWYSSPYTLLLHTSFQSNHITILRSKFINNICISSKNSSFSIPMELEKWNQWYTDYMYLCHAISKTLV